MDLRPVGNIQSFQDASPGGPLIDITSNYLFYAPTGSSRRQEHSKDFLAFTKLPPTSLANKSAGDLRLMQYPLRLQNDERVAAFQLDESQGLLAVITSYPSQPVAVLRFLDFSSADVHPFTVAPRAGICLQFEDNNKCQVQIHQDNVGVLLCGGTNSLTIYDWKTGRERAQCTPTDGGSITSFSFLTADAIVTTNPSTRQIELWEILTDSGMLHRTKSLGLPAIHRGITVEGLDCTPLSPGQLLNPRFSPVITFNLLMCKYTRHGSTSYCLVKFVVYTATLLNLGFSDAGPSRCRHFPWAIWGPTSARCFDDSCAVDHCNRGGQYFVSLSDAECTEAYKLSIYDFGRARFLEHVQKLVPRFNYHELKHDPVFDGEVYTVKMPRSGPRYQAIVPCDRIHVDRDRVFASKYRHKDDHLSIMMYSF